MSGGHWEYNQYRFTEVIEDLRSLIEKNGKEKTKEELRDSIGYSLNDPEYLQKYPEEKYHYKYPDEVIEEFKKGIELISKAQIYMHRIDWLLSGDDGDDTFIRRLKEDLDKL